MKKVLFLVKNIRDQRYGLLCLAAYLKQRGHIADYAYIPDKDSVAEVIKKISQFNPDYLGITAMSGEIKFLLDVLAEIRTAFPDVCTILGGPHATFSPDIIEHPLVDAVCRGEGEEALAEFLELHPSGDYLSVKNFSFMTEGSAVHNPLRPLCALDSLPVPDYDFIPRQDKDKIIVFAARNCIFNCSYCFNKEYRQLYRRYGHKRTYRYMSVDRFLEVLAALKAQYRDKFKYFYFQDDVFPTNPAWLEEFSRRYPEEIGIPFHVGLNPALIKAKPIALLAKAGCFSMNLAIESGSPRIRAIMNRPPMKNHDIVRACREVKKHGIYLDTQNIIMSPTETLEEAKQTLELNIACRVDNGVVGKFQPYPGTRMARFAIDRGLVDEKDILDRLPENYHWESLLHFDERDAVMLDNLLHLFSFTIKYPFMKWLVYRLLPLRWDWLFHRIDNQFWMTHTHRDKLTLCHRSFLGELKVHLLFVKRLLLPLKRSKFVY